MPRDAATATNVSKPGLWCAQSVTRVPKMVQQPSVAEAQWLQAEDILRYQQTPTAKDFRKHGVAGALAAHPDYSCRICDAEVYTESPRDENGVF